MQIQGVQKYALVFHDGTFRFFTAYPSKMNNDNGVVFRVRIDTTPKERAAYKGIKDFDRLIPSDGYEIQQWLKVHKFYPPLMHLPNGDEIAASFIALKNAKPIRVSHYSSI